MQRLVIDCQSGNREYIELSKEEEDGHLAEAALRLEQARAEAKRAVKRQLVSDLAELREMRQNRDIFSDEDMAEKQARIDELKGKLST